MNVLAQFPIESDIDFDSCIRTMFEATPVGIAICTPGGEIREANPAFAKMLGYKRPELAKTNIAALDSKAGEEREEQEGQLAELLRGERDYLEIGKPFLRKDGSYLSAHWTMSLARDGRKQPIFLLAVLTDGATNRGMIEGSDAAPEAVREAERMEAIGRLAAGVAHDFNNLLTGILLYCDLLLAGLKIAELKANQDPSEEPNNGTRRIDEFNPRELTQHVEQVRLAGEQGAALTRQLLAIARRRARESRPVPVNEIVASTENILRRLIGEQIELTVSLDPGLNSSAGVVLGDPAQLQQVLFNLVLNARDALPQGGKIRLSTRAAELSPALRLELPPELSTGDSPASEPQRFIACEIEDNGSGMNAETRARVFEPWFTTKRPGKGTGLGLATVHRIVSEAGGRIEIESEPGKGTRITVLFPAIEKPM